MSEKRKKERKKEKKNRNICATRMSSFAIAAHT
jgi:hypothetical protein